MSLSWTTGQASRTTFANQLQNTPVIGRHCGTSCEKVRYRGVTSSPGQIARRISSRVEFADLLLVIPGLWAGHPRFFLGTDSAPHPAHLKECASACAGVFTTPQTLGYVATTLERIGALDRLRGFACENGPRFYGINPSPTCVRLVRVGEGCAVPESYEFAAMADDPTAGRVVPFLAGRKLAWRVDRSAGR
ncbi:MAG: hypothetical protein BJ554DRAFT_6198 [Olpidium bornovanus]|uniref:Dihydroorotase n=1 Tax=Olpidium bornovanus TaxID=278681 RepID=A0A8H8DKW3_9FUNG|nr:MAG: hypothetical protein BJ554DRAFT_6198 [Olpidium bornovanus]